jgi:preprotein translocase subunit Sss1
MSDFTSFAVRAAAVIVIAGLVGLVIGWAHATRTAGAR